MDKNSKHESIWNENIKLPKFPSLDKSVKTDVLIIGGGIAGILTSYFLKEKGIDCLLAEKDRICCGTTHNTTAKITSQHSLIYQKLAKGGDTRNARLYYVANEAAIEKYAKLCENIDCDFERADNFVYSVNNPHKIERELEVLCKINAKAEFEPAPNLEIPVDTVGAVKFLNQAHFNPLKFLAEISKNLNIVENTFVTDIDGNTAVTSNGKIYADKIIVATHFPMKNSHGSFPLKLYQHRSYVLALKNTVNIDGMYVDESETGMSFRRYKDYLLLGGGGHRTGKKGGGWDELRKFVEQTYPNAKECFHLATQDCMSLDSVPYIGNYSKSTPNLFVASGFNKWGMTSSMVAADILCDLICEKKNEFADLFAPSRNMIKPQLFINGAESVKNLLTITPKRCTHLGCSLKWNSAEHTWDCPCHGSRFDENGTVIDNPAVSNIKMR
ncbi:MAG: FAD-dependent oxidoreductase [Clostridiales bacterium]|nr:FAD-dependent oxidoreductase [Clostridiales bacterium]